MSKFTVTVAPIHFEDFSGTNFERLVFAYLLRTDDWSELEWYGQVGSDSGRDICGNRLRDGKPQGEKVSVLCANWRRLTTTKVTDDLKKLGKSNWAAPDRCIVLCGSPVSASLRDKIKRAVTANGIGECEVWAGPEFEERLRHKAESLLKRFVDGVQFPDTPDEIRTFVGSVKPANDAEIVALMAGLFDRPAFYTPFYSESSIPAFKQAISDTIEGLGTGIHRLRDGTIIRRIPSRHDIKSKETRDAVAKIERKLVNLRAQFDTFVRRGEIKPCSCGQPDCPTFMVSANAAQELDLLRNEILDAFRVIHPAFAVGIGT